jgi:hypothetical protein
MFLTQYINRQESSRQRSDNADHFHRPKEINVADDDDKVIHAVISHSRFRNRGFIGDTDIEALVFLVLLEASKSAERDLKAIMAKLKSINAAKKRKRRELAATAAAMIASALRPAVIQAAPDFSLNAAQELYRWIKFVAESSSDEDDDD